MIPAEYRGAARLLCQRVAKVDAEVEPVIQRALAPLEARLRRHPKKPLRPMTLIGCRRIWREQMPAYARIGSAVDISDPMRPKLREMRIGSARFTTDLWAGNDDVGLIASLIAVRVRRGRVEIDTMILAAASLHAIGRRMQRAEGDSTDEAIFADLGQIALSYVQLIEAGAEEFIVTLPSGQWAGRLLRFDGRVIALAQTFLEHEHGVSTVEPTGIDFETLIETLPEMAVDASGRRGGADRSHPRGPGQEPSARLLNGLLAHEALDVTPPPFA